MIGKAVIGFVLAGLIFGTCFSVYADVTLVKDGVPNAVIFVDSSVMSREKKPADYYGVEVRLKNSVLDLAKYIEKMSGAKLNIEYAVPENMEQVVPIYVGDFAVKVFGELRKKSPYKQGWRYVISEKGIGFIGESEEAVSYAIYELLDRLGCRWYMPSDMGEVVPEIKTIVLKEEDISDIPVTITRNVWYADEDFKRRNRLGGVLYRSGHALEGYVDKKQLAEHPEWNAEIGGKRSINGRLCWAVPECAYAIGDKIIEYLDKHHEQEKSVSISPGDGIDFCECEKCKALDEGDWDSSLGCVSITDRYMQFCNKIAERVVKKYPDVIFGALIYAQYVLPPKREKFHKNIVPQIAPITYCRAHSMSNPECESRQTLKQIVKGWSKVVPAFAYYEYAFNLAEVSAPNPMITKWKEDLPFMYENNMKYWTPETLPNFESTLPGLYMGIRMSWYPKMNPDDILDEFYAKFYGPAKEPMKQYWQTIDGAWSKTPEHAGCGFGYGRIFTPEVMKSARTALDKAIAMPMESRRVKFADDCFRLFEIFMKLRRDLFEGRFADLEKDSKKWLDTHTALKKEYYSQYSFSSWQDVSSSYFEQFFHKTYKDGERIATDYELVQCKGEPYPAIREWKYERDDKKKGEEGGWYKPGSNDANWKTTDSCIETWSDIGLDHTYNGCVWYRKTVTLPAIPEGKKTYLWVSATDGAVKVYVNGKHVEYVNEKGEKKDEFAGYCTPASFDITSAVHSGGDNQITLVATHQYINELGTGGLLGPVIIYRER